MVFLSCSGPAPDQSVYTFFDAMTEGDANQLVQVLDSSVYTGTSNAPGLDTLFDGASFEARRNRILLELTGGELKGLWLSKQVIVGGTQRKGDTATVEVSFVEKDSGKHFLTRFGLVKKGKHWLIFSFKEN